MLRAAPDGRCAPSLVLPFPSHWPHDERILFPCRAAGEESWPNGTRATPSARASRRGTQVPRPSPVASTSDQPARAIPRSSVARAYRNLQDPLAAAATSLGSVSAVWSYRPGREARSGAHPAREPNAARWPDRGTPGVRRAVGEQPVSAPTTAPALGRSRMATGIHDRSGERVVLVGWRGRTGDGGHRTRACDESASPRGQSRASASRVPGRACSEWGREQVARTPWLPVLAPGGAGRPSSVLGECGTV